MDFITILFHSQVLLNKLRVKYSKTNILLKEEELVDLPN